MCEHVSGRMCNLTHEECPYTYYCTKSQMWLPSKAMPSICRVKVQAQVPDGYYRVCFERNGNLYVDIDGNISVISNPFDDVPQYVKATLTKSGNWRLRK